LQEVLEKEAGKALRDAPEQSMRQLIADTVKEAHRAL